MQLEEIIGFAAIGVMWINAEPCIRLRSLYKRTDLFSRLINCCLCSTFHIYLWSQLLLTHSVDILGACVSAIVAEFICRKLNGGSL